jgi:Holliday junction resolvase-like predicted endonuclease
MRPRAQKRRRRDDQPPTPRAGASGEATAAKALAAAGYRVEGRNVRTTHGEIDLLVRKRRVWIAVEVKTRTVHPAPERCVEPAQLDRLERALRSLAPALRPRPRALRIDVVSVLLSRSGPEVLHFPSFRPLAAADVTRSQRLLLRVRSPTPESGCTPTPLRLMPTLAGQIVPRRKLLLMLCETAILTLVTLVGTSVPPLGTSHFKLFEFSWDLVRGLLTCITIAVICQASMSYNDLYDWKTAQNRAQLGNRLVHSCGYSLVMLGFLSLTVKQLFFLPGLADIGKETWKLILLVGLGYFLVYVCRHAFHWFFYKWRVGERIVVLGSSAEALTLARMVIDSPMSGFELLGMVEEPEQPPLVRAPGDPPVLGTLDGLRTLCRDQGIARVVVALQERRGRLPVDRLLDCRMDGVLIEERESMYERLTGKLAVESMRPSYLIYGRGFVKDPLIMVCKRVIEIFASLVGLVLSFPICLLAAVLIKLTSKGPIFFRQERTGQDGATFRLIKFRTMRPDAEKESGPVWAQANDSRITKIGRVLRLSRIDEIP